MILLATIPPGAWVVFPGRRKKFRIVAHSQTLLRVRPGSTSDYADGRNFDQISGTRLKDSSGRYYVVPSFERWVIGVNPG